MTHHISLLFGQPGTSHIPPQNYIPITHKIEATTTALRYWNENHIGYITGKIKQLSSGIN